MEKIKIRSGDLVIPNYDEMKAHNIIIKTDTSPWEVTKNCEGIVTIKRKTLKGGFFYDRFHEDFLIAVVQFKNTEGKKL